MFVDILFLIMYHYIIFTIDSPVNHTDIFLYAELQLVKSNLKIHTLVAALGY